MCFGWYYAIQSTENILLKHRKGIFRVNYETKQVEYTHYIHLNDAEVIDIEISGRFRGNRAI